MRITVLAVFTALSCCAAFKPCSAQFLDAGANEGAGVESPSPTTSPQSIVDTLQPLDVPSGLFTGEIVDHTLAPASATTSVTEQSGGVAQSSATMVESPASTVSEAPSIQGPFDGFSASPADGSTVPPSESESAAEADGQPVGKRHHLQPGQRSMVDTILHYGAYTDLPHAGYMPIQWPNSHGPASMNPVGRSLLRNWCTDGLWAGYAMERAAQCQAIQSRIAGCPHNHCNRYLSHGCRTVAPGIASYAPGRRVNAGASCDSSTASYAPTAPVAYPAATNRPAALNQEVQVPVAPVSVQVPTPAFPSNPQPQPADDLSARDFVAQQPSSFQAPQIR